MRVGPKNLLEGLQHHASFQSHIIKKQLFSFQWAGQTAIGWRSHAPSNKAHGTYEIEKCEWDSIERK